MALRWRLSLALAAAAFLAPGCASFFLVGCGRLATRPRICKMFSANFWHDAPLFALCHLPTRGYYNAHKKPNGAAEHILGKTQR